MNKGIKRLVQIRSSLHGANRKPQTNPISRNEAFQCHLRPLRGNVAVWCQVWASPRDAGRGSHVQASLHPLHLCAGLDIFPSFDPKLFFTPCPINILDNLMVKLEGCKGNKQTRAGPCKSCMLMYRRLCLWSPQTGCREGFDISGSLTRFCTCDEF